MELINRTTYNTYIFRIVGNMRIKILQDYSDAISDIKYISFKSGEMYIDVKNSHQYNIPYDKCYLALSYNKQPNIECVYYTNSYIPLYISQPNKPINDDTLKKYKIKPNTILYNELSIINYKEHELGDELLIDDLLIDELYETKKRIIYPSIIFNNNDYIYLPKKQSYVNNESDYDDDIDDYFTDISASDDPLYN
jgi:hypothetical protein